MWSAAVWLRASAQLQLLTFTCLLKYLSCTTGKHEPQPEPEPLDLPEDLQLDDGERKDGADEDGQEENPFDIDKMIGGYSLKQLPLNHLCMSCSNHLLSVSVNIILTHAVYHVLYIILNQIIF